MLNGTHHTSCFQNQTMIIELSLPTVVPDLILQFNKDWLTATKKVIGQEHCNDFTLKVTAAITKVRRCWLSN